MARLRLTLLGAFQASLGGEPITAFESNKVRALLAYLAVENTHPQRREALATLLWPDWPQASALRNLSYALADLRKNIGDKGAKPSFLLITRETLQLNPESDIWVDLWEFTRSVRDAQSSIINLQSAINFYAGPFLEGFSLPDSAPFEEWLAANREQNLKQATQALQGLVEYYSGRGEYEPALGYARREVALAPWLEEGHQELMRLLALSGQRGEALAQYEACQKVLKDQLDVEPGAETVKLYESIRDGTFGIEDKGKKTEEEPPAPGVPPFKGLQYFDVVDSGLFFGREVLTKHLVSQIWEMIAFRGTGDEAGGCCFLAIVGASGSGKSSIVRAGLVAALKNNKQLPGESSQWPVHIITPTPHPIEALALSLTRSSESITAATTLMDDMKKDSRSLHLYVHRLIDQVGLEGNTPKYLLLVIDQLEELFTLCRSEAESSAFIENLLEASHGPALVVVTLRADFYAHCARYPGLRQALCDRQEYIGTMTAEELRRAIEEPVRIGDWEFEPGLVDLIVRDVGDEPGALPLLEHALLETWQRRSGRKMTLKGYAAAGGVKGAIAHTADTVYSRLNPEQQSIARRIFLRLTELGVGTQDTRRRASLSELIPEDEEATTIRGLLKALADARLVTLGEDNVEVAHEALIREWPTLRGWLNEDRESLRLHRRLTEAAQEWHKMGQDIGELYRGVRLAQAMEWAAQPRNTGELNALETEFLDASQAQAESEVREREAQRQRELENVQKLAETERMRADEQHRSARKLRRRAIYLAGAAGLAAILMVAAGVIAVIANRNAHQATARQYSSAALANLANDPGIGISEALQSIQEEPSVEAYSALHQALFADHLRSRLQAHNERAYGIAINPIGDRLASIGMDRVLKVWRVNGTVIEPIPLLTIPDIGLSYDQYAESYAYFYDLLKFTPDSKYLVTVNDQSEIVMLDAASGRIISRVGLYAQGAPHIIYTIAISPIPSSSGGIQVAALDGSRVWVAELGGGNDHLLGSQTVNSSWGLAMAFRPDGTLITGGWDCQYNDCTGKIYLWKLPTVWDNTEGVSFWDNTLLVETPGDPIYYVNLNPDGSQVIYLNSNEAHALDLTPLSIGSPVKKILSIPLDHKQPGRNINLYYLPDGDRLVLVDVEGRIIIWDARSGEKLFTVAPSLGTINAVIAPVSQVLYTALANGQICAWDIAAPGSPEWLAVPVGGVSDSSALSPDGSSLLTWDTTQSIFGKWQFTRWQIEGDKLVDPKQLTITAAPNPFYSQNYYFSINRLALGFLENSYGLHIYDAATGNLINDIFPDKFSASGITKFVINSNGSRIYFGYANGMVDIWNIATAQQLVSFLAGHGSNSFYPVELNLSSDNSLLLTFNGTFQDVYIQLWDAASGEHLKEFTVPSQVIGAAALTPDNRFLVANWEDLEKGIDSISVWDVASGKQVRSIPLPGICLGLQFSPDGRYLFASLGFSSQNIVFDFANGRELVTLPGSSPSGFSPDRKYAMITIPGDHSAYGFILDNNELVQLACQRLVAITLPDEIGVVPQLPICSAVSSSAQ